MNRPVAAHDTYRTDLAFIHDAGFGSVAVAAAEELLEHLSRAKVSQGTVIELGCGSGILSEKVIRAGFDVVGFDISAAMVRLARKRVPRGKFHVRSFVDARLPPAVAVVAIGEVFNYRFDAKHSERQLPALFRRVYDALAPGGIFLFDLAGSGRAGPAGLTRGFTETDDWTCMYEAAEDPSKRQLTAHHHHVSPAWCDLSSRSRSARVATRSAGDRFETVAWRWLSDEKAEALRVLRIPGGLDRVSGVQEVTHRRAGSRQSAVGNDVKRPRRRCARQEPS